MCALLGPIAGLLCLAVPPTPGPQAGYLFVSERSPQGLIRKTEPYCPREGDLIFFDDHSKFWTFLYAIGHSAPPFHVGIVVKRSDGSLAILESGPDDTVYVFVLEIVNRLNSFQGTISIRRCKRELTPEQSAALTQFAEAQEGKRYAVGRLLLQGTAVRARYGLRWKHYGKTFAERDAWLCAEIVVSAGALVGLFDGDEVKANGTYPLDIVDDRYYDLSPVFAENAYWAPCPPPAK